MPPTPTLRERFQLKQIPVAAASGRIAELSPGQGTGIISVPARRSVFFHKTDVRGRFLDLKIGDVVRFVLIDDAISGPRARDVNVKRTTRES